MKGGVIIGEKKAPIAYKVFKKVLKALPVYDPVFNVRG